MTTALSWLTRIGIYALLLGPLLVADRFIVVQLGPVLRNAGMLTSVAVLACVATGLYRWGSGDVVACWRACYLVPAIVLGFTAYCNTGFRWIEDRAMALSEPQDRLAALSEHPPPGPSPQWVARVQRDVKIAKAEEEYEVRIAQLAGGQSTPLPRSITPALCVGAFIFLGVALLPRHRIEEVLERLRS